MKVCFNANVMQATLQAALPDIPPERITVEPSAVSRSPHMYVYVHLTDELHDGPHIIVSEGEEYGEPGILVGRYDHWEEPADVITTVFHTADVIPWVLDNKEVE